MDHELSKNYVIVIPMQFSIGTAQFGSIYGVTNNTGKVSQREIYSITQLAKRSGVSQLDTAQGYGNAEQLLGEIGVGAFDVTTKTSSINAGTEAVIKDFHCSLKKLGLNQVYGLLIHDINEIANPNFHQLYQRVARLKKDGFVKKIGFSVYSPYEIDILLDRFEFDIIQLPFNALDGRLLVSDHLKRLKNKGVEVQARSIFLQGLLLSPENMPKSFSRWLPEFHSYFSGVVKSGLSPLKYALNYVLINESIDTVIVGVQNTSQLEAILEAVEPSLRIEAATCLDENLLNPSLWGNF